MLFRQLCSYNFDESCATVHVAAFLMTAFVCLFMTTALCQLELGANRTLDDTDGITSNIALHVVQESAVDRDSDTESQASSYSDTDQVVDVEQLPSDSRLSP